MAEVAQLIRDRSGLTFPEIRVRDVEATVQRTMQRRALSDVPELLRVLRDDAAARDALVAELTIGETYFHRDPGQFALLRNRILPELLGRSASRPVRVWSAGCASGEEPYTIAMLMDEFGAAGRAQIVGTDIARPRLADAQRAVYSKWSLRGTSPELRARYFRERGRFFELLPRIREQVDFRYLNLAEDRFPSLAAGVWGMDLILCRNVLIYFDAATVAEVARRLIATLSEDGWLVLGASDPAISDMVACDAVLTDAGLVYRRPGAAGSAGVTSLGVPAAANPHTEGGDGSPAGADAPDAAAHASDAAAAHAADAAAHAADAAARAADAAAGMDPSVASGAAKGQGVARPHADPAGDPASDARPRADLPHLEASRPRRDMPVSGAGLEAEGDAVDSIDDRLEEAYARRDFSAVVRLAQSAPPAVLSDGGWVAWLRALANQGCLEDAGLVAARALDTHGPTAELLYLHAVLLLQSGRPAEAAAAARRALYLDRTLVVAHLTLADAHQRGGNVDAARRSLRNAAALLASLDRDTHVPASDGDTAGRLAELVSVKLRLLDDAA